MKANPLFMASKFSLKKDQKLKQEYKAVDLFCGAGGMSLGIQMAGFKIKLGLDFVKAAN
tara:strand:- start:320 stop:496 length:177 start_codon:yes stop_codon:yes gene_type:complete